MPDSAIDTIAAQAYEDYLVGSLFEPWAQKAVAMAAPQPGESVLDIACGTGIGARLAAASLSPGGSIVSADLDPGMVAVAEETAAASGLPADVRLDWRVTPAEKAIVPDASVDLVLCLIGPQFVTDPPVAMARMFAALKPGGRLVASFWNEYSTNKGHYAIGQALLARGIKPALKPFSLGDPQAGRLLFDNAGFVIEAFDTATQNIAFPSTKAFVDGVAAGAPATRHALAQLTAADFDGFVADVDAFLSPYRTELGLSLPTSAHLVLARRPA